MRWRFGLAASTKLINTEPG